MTKNVALNVRDRLMLAATQLQMQYEANARAGFSGVTDSDVLTAAECWTTSDLRGDDVNDYEAMRDVLFDWVMGQAS